MAASFYSQIAANRRNSFLLVLVIVALLGALGFAIGYGTTGVAAGGLGWLGIFGVIAIVTSLVGYFSGDRVVLAASKARPATEAEAPQLLNVVRELTLSAGIPDAERLPHRRHRPNAFATGRDPKHASIAVTTGLLEQLDREELQGVIGHELSHVRNLDIRFALLVGVLVGTIALLADVFLRMTFWGGFGRRSSSSDRGGGGGLQVLVFVIAIVLAILAPIFARLVQLAVSRQREYLADAARVELTRNPHGPRAGAGGPRRRPGGPRGGQPGHPAPLLREPDPRSSRTARRGSSPPTRRSSTGSIGCGRWPARRPSTTPTCRRSRAAASRVARAARGRRPARRRPRRGARFLAAGWPFVVRFRPPTGGDAWRGLRAEIAQLVEHATENRGVASSNLALGTICPGRHSERKWLSW